MPETKTKPQQVQQSITPDPDLEALREITEKIWEPKTISRFVCYITDKDKNQIIPPYLIKEITRPSAILKHDRWVWNPIRIKVYDPIVPTTAQIFYNYITQGHAKKFDITINVLGPVGDSVEKWEIKNAKIVEVDFGTLDWCDGKSNEKSKIDVINVVHHYKGSPPLAIAATIKYNSATLLY